MNEKLQVYISALEALRETATNEGYKAALNYAIQNLQQEQYGNSLQMMST